MRHRTVPSSSPNNNSSSSTDGNQSSSTQSNGNSSSRNNRLSSSSGTGENYLKNNHNNNTTDSSPSAQFLYSYLKRDTYAHYALSWEDPLSSSTFLAYGLAIYIAYNVLDYPFLSVIVWFGLLGLILTGIIHCIRLFRLENKVPPVLAFLKDKPRLAINSDYIRTSCNQLGESIVSFLFLVNNYLQWSPPYDSIKAICSLWLMSRYIYLFSPGYLLFFYVISFGILPSYRRIQNELDRIIGTFVIPYAVKLAIIQKDIETLFFRYYSLYPLLVPIISSFGIGTILWTFWDFWTIISLCTLISFLFLCVDLWNSTAFRTTTPQTGNGTSKPNSSNNSSNTSSSNSNSKTE